MNKNNIKELIIRRQKQILIHSCIYYRFNNNLISDFKYDEWSHELIKLLNENPDLIDKCLFPKDFKKFSDGGSGYNLSYNKPWIVNMAQQLINYHEKLR